MSKNRTWEGWDDPGVAEDIDRYWSADPSGYETIHRSILAKLVQKYLTSPTEKVLEVGCGNGLVYGELVPQVVVNSCYVGVDTSLKMLEIARKRYPSGQFVYGDAYGLPFPSNSFDVTLCFEVLGHLPEIQKPINELFRVASRRVIFTVWASPEDQTLTSDEKVRDSHFLHISYSKDDIVKAVRQAANGESHLIETRVLSDTTWAYIVSKGQASRTTKVSQPDRVLPFHGLTNLFIRRQTNLKTELDRIRQEHANVSEALNRSQLKLLEHETELEEVRTILKNRDTQLSQMQATLAVRKAELEEIRRIMASRETELDKVRSALGSRETELEKVRSKGRIITRELDMFRHRKVTRWMNRILATSTAWQDISPPFQQLKDDSLIFNKRLKGYRLQPSVNLQRIPFVRYPLDLNRPNLTGILLAPIVDLPLTNGVIGIEIVSPSNSIVTQHVVPANQIDESVPIRFDFSPIRDSDRRASGSGYLPVILTHRCEYLNGGNSLPLDWVR